MGNGSVTGDDRYTSLYDDIVRPNGSETDPRRTALDVRIVSVYGKDPVGAEPEYDLAKS